VGLYISDNQIAFKIPSELGNLPEMSKCFQAVTDATFTSCLTFVCLSFFCFPGNFEANNNQLTGTVPTELSNLGNLSKCPNFHVFGVL
jgi:hypothetical protein